MEILVKSVWKFACLLFGYIQKYFELSVLCMDLQCFENWNLAVNVVLLTMLKYQKYHFKVQKTNISTFIHAELILEMLLYLYFMYYMAYVNILVFRISADVSLNDINVT